MIIAINYKPKSIAWGGGNQFVQQIVNHLRKNGHKVTFKLSSKVTHIFLVKVPSGKMVTFDVDDIRKFKKKNRNVKCVHRINECGKRKESFEIDEILREANSVADHTIFISEWLKDYFSRRWFNDEKKSDIILNAASDSIFNLNKFKPYTDGDIFKLVTHHWSGHWMKGFKSYELIDHLISEGQLKNVELSIIGRWPKEIQWKTAKLYSPCYGKKLAKILSEKHCYVTASLWEPCGMHHVEGIQCGLPIIYHINGGGIVEVASKCGLSFDDSVQSVKYAVENIKHNYTDFIKKVFKYSPSGKFMCAEYERIFTEL